MPLPPWEERPGEAAQGHPGGKWPQKSPGSHPPLPPPLQRRPPGMERDGMERDRMGWDGMGWSGMGWNGMGWPLRGLLGAGFFISRPVPSPAEQRGGSAGRAGGGGGPAAGRARIERGEEKGERLRQKFGAREAEAGRGSRGEPRDTHGARPGLPQSRCPAGRQGKVEITNKQEKTEAAVVEGKGAAVRCSRRHRSTVLANSFFFLLLSFL